MKEFTTLAALLALTSLSAFAEDKPEAKPAETPAAESPAKPEGDKKNKPKPSPQERFKKLDKNGDGFLSIDEFRGKKTAEEAAEAFKKMDTDGDGKISLEEFSAPQPKKKK
jgi:hypothetical protein